VIRNNVFENFPQISKNEHVKMIESGDPRIDFDFVNLPIDEVRIIRKDHDKILLLKCNGRSFEYWSSQNELVPPWITNWYQLKDYNLIKLENDLLKELIESCVVKSGNLNKFCKKVNMGYPSFWHTLKGNIKMVSVKKLKKLSHFLDMPYDFFNDKMVELRKGSKASIKKPKFPINLNSPEGGKLLGAVVSDGCLYKDKKARGVIRTKYSNDDSELIGIFKKNIQKIFGDVHVQSWNERNCTTLRIGSSIIGNSLYKVGGIIGAKCKVDGPTPWLVRNGGLEIKRNYLRIVFSDEGSVGRSRKYPYIILSRYKHITKMLKRKQIEILDKLIEPHMKINRFPTGHVIKRLRIRKILDLLEENDNKISNGITYILSEKSILKLLLNESEMLSEDFGIENNTYLIGLTKTQKGNYSAESSLVIRKKESVIKFKDEIGFAATKKHKKLENYLSKIGG